MFTATDRILLPTTVTGSWPRPSWFDVNLDGRSVSTAMRDNQYREKFLDATAALVAVQERAGLDILTNGDYHHDDNLGGQSWMLYPPERLGGLDNRRPLQSNADWAYPPGTILNEVMGGWRYPAVLGELHEDVPLELDKVWRVTQGFATAPVKIGTASAQVIGSMLVNQSTHYSDDGMQLAWDLSVLVNEELKRLAAAGCQVIQIEDPMIHLAAASNPPREYMDHMVNCLNREIADLDCEVWIHTCWGNPNMQRVQEDTSYAPSLDDYLYRVNCDVLTLEMRDRGFAEIELLARYKDSGKKLAVGVVSHRGLQVETGEEIAAAVRRCLQYVDADMLVLSTDCGFGRQGFNRVVAAHKAAAIVRGANIVRKELGAQVTEPRHDRRDLQIDAMPEQAGKYSRT